MLKINTKSAKKINTKIKFIPRSIVASAYQSETVVPSL